jgi:cytidylate kinase
MLKSKSTNQTVTKIEPAEAKTRINLPVKTSIRVYGLLGVGKGALSQNLSNELGLVNIDTGSIWRAVTFIATSQNWEASEEAIAKALDELQPVVQANKMLLKYGSEILGPSQLRTKEVDANVTKFSTLSKQGRAWFNQFIIDFIHRCQQPTVSDGRGANEDYLLEIEREGFKILRIQLTADLTTKVQRRFKDYLKIESIRDPEILTNLQKQQELYEICYQTVVERDKLDLENIKSKGLGLTTKDSKVIDTTNLSLEEVKREALKFIYQSLMDISKQEQKTSQ